MNVDVNIDQLHELEGQLLQPARRRDAAWVASVLAEDYEEFGMSGRSYDRDATIEIMSLERAVERTIEDFRVRPITDGAALTTYISTRIRDGGSQQVRTRRSSTWVLTDGAWRLRFHHSTRIPD